VVIYLDTSAFLKLYIREDGSEAVQAAMESQDQPIPIPDLLQWEFLNAMRLKVFWGELDEPTVDHLVALFDDRLLRGQYLTPELDRARVTTDVRELSHHTQAIGSRTLDVVHVAVALQLQPSSFITFDVRQRTLAESAGLVVG
jgi:predicted nucleic acid-binding protein